ncbi:3-isopropylmalate dehydrogenase [Candidatus Xiphinematobacter sp. Idaho Grape]|uniref:3-isopropylmalate dehydrogenase n=1 Tax=Candidatus Xiphinematobacter sp. Idaho Grape TaxID=1704307 RepID=UPI0007065C90|nr:3-isopropylmalate dehydrogenase [Candidatus Xiphinematobacter sp. Idaho Grape]ALJ56807.1 3-isopropylmalate dehydrogenase [Candidatus Xiphinematobacter sp. Idaho Grape]
MTAQIAVLVGDGIGPEVMEEALRVLYKVQSHFGLRLKLTRQLVGGAAIDATGVALPPQTLQACETSDAILFGSVGGPKWAFLPPERQPERAALLFLRRHFSLFANLRPAICLPALAHASPLHPRIVMKGFNILCVRELTGGLYFGEPKGISEEKGERVAVDTMVYRESEIRRVAKVAFDAALLRSRHLTSIDKANVLQNGVLWRRIVDDVAAHYPDVSLNHLYIDNAAMQLIRNPCNFDVLLTENLFGDVLSDEVAMLAGSIGMLPSASLSARATPQGRFGLYEPSGGSAPDIAGKGVANPIAQILSVAMLLRYSFSTSQSAVAAATAIENAVCSVITEGRLRTADIWTEGTTKVGTSEMGKAIADAISFQ